MCSFPGGVAVVSSWRPFSEAPLMEAVLGALSEQLPDLPVGNSSAQMAETSDMISELEAAGFREVGWSEWNILWKPPARGS